MADFEITSPDGKRFVVTAPDGATQEQILSYAQSQFKPTPPPTLGEVARNAAAKGAAGVADMFGNAPANAWNLGQGAIGGIAELAGHPEVWASRSYMQQPNLAHKALESIGLIDPTKNPQTQGQRILDTAVQGGVGGVAGPGGIVRNALTGMTAGAASQYTKEKSGSDAAAIGVGLLTPFAIRAATVGKHPAHTPVREQTFQEGRAIGLKVPPTAINPSFINNKLESIAGKAAIKQDVTARNQAAVNRAATNDLDLPEGTPLTETTYKQFRDDASQPYRDVANLSPHAKDALDELKKARFESKRQWNFFNKSGNPTAQDAAMKADAEVAQYEQMIEHEAQQAGRQELVQALAESRRKIAKSYDVERATNLGDGTVSAPMIGRDLDRAGVGGKSGDLAVVGKFQQAFPQFMGEASRTPAAGVSGTDAASSAFLGTMGYGAAGVPGIAAAGLPLLRSPARAFALSDFYQKRMLPEDLGATFDRSALIARAIAERNQH